MRGNENESRKKRGGGGKVSTCCVPQQGMRNVMGKLSPLSSETLDEKVLEDWGCET